LRKSVFLFIFAFLVYFLISTIVPSFSYVGKFGAFLGKTNLSLFGYLGYIFPFLLMYLLYAFYKEKFDSDFSLKVLGGIFVFFALLLMQYEIFNKGVIAQLFASFLESYIGVIGVWIFVFLLFAWAGFLIFEEKIMNFIIKKEKITTENSYENYNKIKNEIKIENGLLDDDIEIDNSENEKAEDKQTGESKIEDKNDKFEKLEIENENIENKEVENKKLKTENREIEFKKENKEKNVQKVEVLEDTKKLLSQIETGKRDLPKNWKFPSLEFLTKPKNEKKIVNEAEIDKKIKILIEKLKQFKIEGDVVRYYIVPVVTTFEFKPLPHIKVSKILALQDDLAMALKAQSIRIQAPIPGKDVVGIEIPNEKMQTIYLREILESDIFKKSKSPLTIALGKDIVGSPFVTDLKKLPHL
jgi:S-DNA-T family DNA segregation ATPase FtsK/SpoIIIE